MLTYVNRVFIFYGICMWKKRKYISVYTPKNNVKFIKLNTRRLINKKRKKALD